MCHIVTLAEGSSRHEKSAALLDYARRWLRRGGVHTHDILVRDLNREWPTATGTECEPLLAANLLLDQAEGVIIAISGDSTADHAPLSRFLNGLPSGALAGKTVLLLATDSSREYPVAVEPLLHQTLSVLGATHILPVVNASEAQMRFEHGGLLRLDGDVECRLSAGLEALVGDHPWQTRGKRPALACTPLTV